MPQIILTSRLAMLDELKARNLSSSTVVIVTAKHGHSPMDVEKKQIVDEEIISKIVVGVQPDLLAESIGDSIRMIWLKDQNKTGAVVSALRAMQASAHIQRFFPAKA